MNVTCAFVLSVLLVTPALARGSDYGVYQVPSLTRPELDAGLTDPTFGSTVTRRTDPKMSIGASGVFHEYVKYSAVNSNGTLLAVQTLGGDNRGAWRIQNMITHAWIATLSTQGDPEISWSPTDPNLLLYRKNNQILCYHVDTGRTDILLTASNYRTISDNEEGRPSLDWHYWAGIGIRSDGSRDVVVADLLTHSIIAKLASVTASIDWVSMSMSGAFVVVQYTDGKGTLVYNRQLVFQRAAFADFTHADLALDAAGADQVIYIAVTGGQIMELGCPHTPNGSPIASARLSDGQKKILLGDCYDANWKPVITGVFLPWGGAYHFSGILSRARPGWVLVSTYQDKGVVQMPFSREIFSLKTDGSGTVERLAHHQSQTDGDYWAEPHAVPSWDGTQVFFASTWGPTGRYDLYQLGAVSPPPPPPPPTDNGGYTCTSLFQRQPDGSLSGFSTQCVR